MGSKGTSSQTQSGVSSYTANPATQDAATQALGQAQTAAQSPFQLPVAPVAGLNQQQQQGFAQIGQAQGMAQPYYNQSQQLFNQSAAPITSQQINQYLNPYAGNVLSQLANQQGQQMNQLTGQATQTAGGVGADRIGVAQGELANQQNLATGQTLSGIYGSALSAAQQNAQMQQAAAYGIGNLGGAAQNASLQGSQALIGAGNQQQAQTQAQLNAPYQNTLAQIAFPYQQAQYLSGITGSLAGALGGTTVSNQAGTSTPAAPSIFSQLAGAGTAAAGAYGAFNSLGYGANSLAGSALSGEAPSNSAISNATDAQASQYESMFGSARGGRIGYADGGDTSGEPAWLTADPTIPTIAMHASQVQQPKIIPLNMGSGSSGSSSTLSDIGNIAKAAATIIPLLSAGGSVGTTPYQAFADGGDASLGKAFVNGAKAWWDGAKWVAGGGQQGWTGGQDRGPQPPPYTGGEDYPPKKYADGGETEDYVPQDFESRFRDAATMGQIERPRFADSPTLGAMPRGVALAHYLNDPSAIRARNDSPVGTPPPAPPGVVNPDNPYRMPDVKADGSPIVPSDHMTPSGVPDNVPGTPPSTSSGMAAISPGAAQTSASNMAAMTGQKYDVPYSDLDPTHDEGRGFARSPWLALMNAGFGMMAGTSPYAGVNIGKGFQQGVQTLETQRKDEREEETVNQRAKQLALEADKHLREYTQLTPVAAANIENQKKQRELQETQIEEQGWQKGAENILTGDTTYFNPRSGESGLLKRDGTWVPAQKGAPGAPSAPSPDQTPPNAIPTQGTAPAPAPYGVPALASNLTPPPSNLGYIGKGSPLGVASTQDIKTTIAAQNKAAQTLPALEQDLTAMKLSYATLTKDADKDGFLSRLALQPGANFGDRLERAKQANALALAAGEKPPFDPAKVAAAENINKIQNRMGLTFSAQISPREAFAGQKIGIESSPGLTNSPQGFRRLIAGFEAGVNNTRDEQAFFQNYLQKNGTSLGWRQAFEQQNPSERYVVKALMGMLPENLQKGLPEAIQQLRSNPAKYKDTFNKYYNDTADFYLRAQ